MVRSVFVGVVLALAVLLPSSDAGPAAGPAHGYWVEPETSEDWQVALHRAAGDDDRARAAQALADIAARGGHSTEAALAHLGAGLILVEIGRHAEAIPHLTDPDLPKTHLEDFALRALAEAYERTGDFQRAALAHHALADRPDPNPLRCDALVRGAEVDDVLGRRDDALGLLQRALAACPDAEAQALLQLGAIRAQRGEIKEAADALERVDRDHPNTPQGKEAEARLGKLAGKLPPMTTAERLSHGLKKGLVLFESGDHKAAVKVFQYLLLLKPPPDEADLIRVRLGRALLALDRARAARDALAKVSRGSAVEPEAAYHLAQIAAARGQTSAYESVATRFPGTPWAEEALIDLAHHADKDGRFDEAVPYYRRIYEGYPRGRYVDPATLRIAFGEYRQKHLETAAEVLEKGARERPSILWRPAYLYWAGRVRRDLGQEDRARVLFEEVATRYRHAYHGLLAREALGQVTSGASTTHPAPPPGMPSVPEPHLTRTRNLLLIERLSEAMDELGGAPPSPQVQATRSYLFWRQGKLRPAITAMKRAYPEYVTEAGDSLPDPVWRILYPLAYEDALAASAQAAGVDPALVAALVCQESTFDTSAVSTAGARGLMQLMVPTGRALARAAGMQTAGTKTKRFDPRLLNDPRVGLQLGSVYLKEMIGRFGGRVEQALAAYNAGPHRVAVWSLARPGMSPEEFVDTIPFQETRTYVMTILAAQAQYRRIYGLPAAGVGSADGTRP